MNALLTLCAVLVIGATFANGKLYKRDLRERSLSEFLHITQNTSPQELQCMLDGIRECEKKLYVRDLTEELNEIGKLLKKLKEIDWSDDNLDVMQVLEHDEFELLGKIMHLNNQLPKTWDEATQTYTPFGHVIDQCFKDIAAIDLSAEQSFEDARDRVLKKVIECEENGFKMSVDHMGKIDVNDVKSILNGINTIKEIMAEVRDMNYAAIGINFLDGANYPDPSTWDNAFEKDAVSPSNIKNAVKELFERFAPGDDSKEKPDVNVTSRRLAKKMVAAHQSAIASKKDELRKRIAALLKNLDD